MASPVKAAKTKHIAAGFSEVVDRGRGHLRSRKPGTNQYTLSTQVGQAGWHRGGGPYTEADEVDTAWVQNGVTYEMLLGDPFQAEVNVAQRSYRYEDMGSGESVELFVESVLKWVNDNGDSETAAGLSAPTTSVDDDTISFEGLFGAGSRLTIQAQTARLKKLLTLDNDTILSTPTLSGTVYLALDLRFQRSGGVTIWVDGVEWDEKSNNPQLSSSAIEFRDATDTVLFRFNVPYARDDSAGDNDRQDGAMSLKKAGVNLFAEVRVPYAWLAAAVYPIEIDPTISAQAVTADDQDASEKDNDTTPSSTIFNTSANTSSASRYNAGAYFAISGPAQGDTVDSCYLTLNPRPARATCNTDIVGHDIDSTVDFTADPDIYNRVKTTASVAYDNTGMSHTTDYDTSEIKTVAQEIFDRASWDAAAIMIIVKGAADVIDNMVWEDYSNSTTLCARLTLVYTVAATGRRHVRISHT